jgi:DNA adenine methylase
MFKNGIFNYYGGKAFMVPDVFKAIAPVRKGIKVFVDVFGGSGRILINVPLEWKVPMLVFNDLDSRIYNLMKVMQSDEKRSQLVGMLDYSVVSHQELDFLNDQDQEKVSDVQSAYGMIYTLMYSFNSGMKNYMPHANFKTQRDFQISKINNTYRRVQRWNVENLDFREAIKRYDGPDTFFYLDPPYMKGGKSYYHSFSPEDFRDLAELMRGMKGKCLMNESNVDFELLEPIFGKPKFVRSYINYGQHVDIGEKKSRRREGYWFNWDYSGPYEVVASEFKNPLIQKEL